MVKSYFVVLSSKAHAKSVKQYETAHITWLRSLAYRLSVAADFLSVQWQANGHNSSVSMVTALKTAVTNVQAAPGSVRPPETWDSSSGGKAVGTWIQLSLSSIWYEVKNEWSDTFTSPYIVIVYILVQYGDRFISLFVSQWRALVSAELYLWRITCTWLYFGVLGNFRNVNITLTDVLTTVSVFSSGNTS
jgi:hypothetical protein